jgi:lysophospholipase L1-like esterase
MRYAALILIAALAAIPARAAVPECPVKSVEASLTAPLTRTANKFRSGGELVIVALGSSSTAGYGASTPAGAYPSRLAAELRERLPGIKVEVLNKGVGGESDVDMLKRFDRDVLSFKPDLVIWQLGTNAVLKDDGMGGHAPPIREGIGRLKVAGIDVILMNPQYAPKVLKDPDHPDMLQLLDLVGRQENVSVFGRFAIMRDWVTSGRADFGAILSADGLHMNDTSYRCIAHLLADAIVTAVSPMPAALLATNPKH